MRLFLIAAALATAPTAFAATLSEVAGLVQIRPAGSGSWRPAKRGSVLRDGDSLRTGFDARATLLSETGSAFYAAGNAHLAVEADGPKRVLLFVLFGAVKVDARVLGGKQAAVRTPVVVLRGRADEATFVVAVGAGGKTTVDVKDGLVGAEDNQGAAALLRPGQRLEADMRGLRAAAASPTPARARRDDFAARMRRELGLDLARDESLERAARETRRAEHELGRLLTDSAGRRVRVEEYVTRPSASSFMLVALNQRPGRLDAFAWTGVFNAPLPVDLGPVLTSLAGTYEAAAPWTLTGYDALFTNGKDRLVERADGGHQVDLNANGDPLDDVAGGRPFFYTLFDRTGLYVDGTLKRGWTGANIQAQSEAVAASANDPFTGAALPVALPAVTINTTMPDAGAQARRRLDSYADGTELRRDDRVLADGGGTAAAPASPLERGVHLSVAASEWSGRTIELVASPRILILTRQLP